MKKVFPSDKQDQYMVRFPDGMRGRLKDAAAENKRSLNAEIIARLEQSFNPIPADAVIMTRDQMLEMLADLASMVESGGIRTPERADNLKYSDERDKERAEKRAKLPPTSKRQ